MKITPKFKFGTVVATAGVNHKMEIDDNFRQFVWNSFRKYIQGDWGDTCDEDKQTNNDALKYGERLLAAYKFHDVTIWIITEWDRSTTTILFPDEY